MQLVKVSAQHYINTDLIIEVYPHLVEPALTVVMAAPPTAVSGTEASAPHTIYTIELKGEEAENFGHWLDVVAQDGRRHVALGEPG